MATKSLGKQANWCPGAEQSAVVTGATTGGSFAVAGGVGGQYPIQPGDQILDIESSASGEYMAGAPTIIPKELAVCTVAGYVSIPTINTSSDTLLVRFISSLAINGAA